MPRNFSTKPYGERNITAKSLFTTITLFIKLTKINNFGNGKREGGKWQSPQS
jgi:hypothetical protein